eukprot:COSAG02_NODE_1772_length_10984_cov_8.166651_3_plen_171_part_00
MCGTTLPRLNQQLVKPMPALSPEMVSARRALRDTADKDGPAASAQDALEAAAVLREILATPLHAKPDMETDSDEELEPWPDVDYVFQMETKQQPHQLPPEPEPALVPSSAPARRRRGRYRCKKSPEPSDAKSEDRDHCFSPERVFVRKEKGERPPRRYDKLELVIDGVED